LIGSFTLTCNATGFEPFQQAIVLGADEMGKRAPSGIYFCKVNENDRVITKKLTILK